MKRLALILALASAPLARGGEPPKPPAPPEGDKPFAELVKDARAIPGILTVHRSEDKVLLELHPGDFDKLFYVALTLESGLGERGFYASQVGGIAPLLFHREGKTVQLVRKNTRFTGGGAVERSFSDSVLATTTLAALPHPERKSVLVDLGSLFLTDLPDLAWGLESEFRVPYALDVKGSRFGPIQGFPGNLEVEAVLRYAVEKLPVPPLLAPGAPPPSTPPPPRNLPDARSLLLRVHYSIAQPPPPGYVPRLADDRVGHFLVERDDFTTDTATSPTRRFVTRWRLEKQDPQAPLSRPKQPIVFYLEDTIPEAYRPAIREGVLVWNRAFARLGFENAIEVRDQPKGPDWSAGDLRYSTIRWFAGTDATFAIGPSNADPLTGEILDADISVAAELTRLLRREAGDFLGPLTPPARPLARWGGEAGTACDMAAGAAAQAAFGLDLLTARGMAPDGPEADAYLRDFLVGLIAHEVGHTLGLRHNFRSSLLHTQAELQDPAIADLAGSVMDYTPTNLAEDPAHRGAYFQKVLGPYDEWAIEYAYTVTGAATPEAEIPALQRIAARSAEPALAYGTDEEVPWGSVPFDMDPEVSRWDLGADPLAFHALRLRLSAEMVANMEARLEQPGAGYQVLRRSFDLAMNEAGRSLLLASKYVGGVVAHRDHVGDPGGRLPLNPVDRARQEEAMKLLEDRLFAPDALAIPPRLARKLIGEHWRAPDGTPLARRDLPVHALVLSLQQRVLDRLLHPVVLARLQDADPGDGQAFGIARLFDGLQGAIWAETKTGAPISSPRRALQRDHLRRLVQLVLADAAPPEDARSMARRSLVALQKQVKATLARPGSRTPETEAHLQETLARIDGALSAHAQRTAF